MPDDIFNETDENEVPTVETTLKDIKNIVSIIEETLQAPRALPNRKGALRDYVAQLKEATLRLGIVIEVSE